ncbi:MAG: small subunit ribosomal protein [Thermoleophilaceae bacterium]|nr:small subunit ribosomal protein [Thermoleophilaceae bacterium]
MIDDERPDAPQEGGEAADAPEEAQPAADEAPAAGDEQETPDEAPAAGDEPLTEVEDEGEQVTEAPEPAAEADGTDEPPADPPNESAPGHVDPAEVKDAEPSPDPSTDPDAPNESTQPSEAAQPARRERPGGDSDEKKKEEVVPGAHLEPDLVLEEARAAGDEDEYADRYATSEEGEQPAADGETPAGGDAPAASEAPRTVVDLAADARYQATGKRKTSVARVILKPGDGAYSINGRSLEDYFPRAALQKAARQPLQTAGFEKRMNVTARIHGGGISAQAGALRHGVARALVEADPSLRTELKRRGFLSRDDRAKERKKAGLKKARKRPQFSKR